MERHATCHCGAVQLRITAAEFGEIYRCNCSICNRKGAVMGLVMAADLTVAAGQDFLTEYSFNTHTAKHYFCRCCGIYTHHRRRVDPGEYGVNLGCIDGIKLEDYTSIPCYDGRENHPSDGASDKS